MKTFLIRLALFGLVFFLVDKVFYVFIIQAPETEADTRLEQLINGQINKDILIVGSSRGARTVLAQQLEEETGLSSYNLSWPGSGIEFHEYVIRTLLKFNAAPKIILLAIDDPDALISNEVIIFRLDRLYPLVKYDHVMEELYHRGEKNELLARTFMLHRMYYGNLDLRKKTFSALDTILDCGSMPISFQRENVDWTYEAVRNDYDASNESRARLTAFRKVLRMCSEHDIQLAFFFPPCYKAHNRVFEQRIRELTPDAIPFCVYDTTKIDIYRNRSFYYDTGHVMQNGAREFTSELSAFVRDSLLRR